jgi:Tfp pilus assembly protein PilV
MASYLLIKFTTFLNRLSNKPIIQNNSGTSLIEVIIGMVILAMLVAGLNAGVLSLVNTNKSSKEISAASNFGYEKLEEMRRDDYGNILTRGEKVEGMYKYNIQVTSDGENTQKKIELFIKWPSSAQNPKHLISLSTIIAKP